MILCDLEIFAEHHKFGDGHDGGFVHDLLEGWILACGVCEFAVVLEDYFEVVFVFSG